MSTGYNNTTFNEIVVNTNISNTDEFKLVCRVLWLCGVAVSCAGLCLQLGLLWRVPQCRKYDEKVLALLSAARILYTVCEYLVVNEGRRIPSGIVKDFVFCSYFQTDFMMVCWMFVFSKNLYDKVVLVFTFRRYSLLTISLVIFFISLPFGVLCPYLLAYYANTYFHTFYKTYAGIKFIVIVINALIFVRILSIAHVRGSNTTRHVAHYIKAAIVSFILVCITSLQVFVTDLLSLAIGSNDVITYSNCVLNSFQVVIISVIFVTLARGKQRRRADSRSTVIVRLRSETT